MIGLMTRNLTRTAGIYLVFNLAINYSLTGKNDLSPDIPLFYLVRVVAVASTVICFHKWQHVSIPNSKVA